MKRNKPKYRQIIDAAVVVIADNGFHQAQVSKIAKKAGVADGTIYLYFKNKEDILISLFEDKMGQFTEKIEEVIAGKSNSVEKLLALVKMHLYQLADDPNLAIVTQIELRQSNTELRVKINEVLKDYIKIIDQVLRQGIEEGLFKENLNVKLARQMIFGTLDEVVTNWVMNEQKYDLREIVEPVHQLLIDGISV
ncbi:TetR/AcrR family transcriptional regulator [Calidifontibacillus oryziterrae]|uniref:TetR/AcrR family transcriptional regulator n=1 Tax=Calidifontibacillus oryziterrae TaxID=1191699 RepID=UPI00030D140E|nr:TetR/AcrR family transcriptional regulator [Calidifontibacillus oryziterrae]